MTTEEMYKLEPTGNPVDQCKTCKYYRPAAGEDGFCSRLMLNFDEDFGCIFHEEKGNHANSD